MKIVQYYQTIRHLKWVQIRYRIWYQIKRRLIELGWQNERFRRIQDVEVYPVAPQKCHCRVSSNRLSELRKGKFTFLNESREFKGEIEWHRDDLNEGTRLWKLNLHYHEFLVDALEAWKQGDVHALQFIQQTVSDWIEKNALGRKKFSRDHWNSYCISLRLMAWVKVLSACRNEFGDSFMKQWISSAKNQADFLYENLEYDIQGNHLMENAFGLLNVAIFFRSQAFYNRATKLLDRELSIQILEDGAHFELSPMYHSIIAQRLLDSVHLLERDTWKDHDKILTKLRTKAALMMGWLDQITNQGKELPLLNDAANGVAPSPGQLFRYAETLGIEKKHVSLGVSGYRILENQRLRVLVDVGPVGPDFIPGHAHADSLQILCWIDEKPFLVDTGTSLYNPGAIRDRERSTSSHNTVSIRDCSSSQMWSSFRVASRARTKIEKEEGNVIMASHDGYLRYAVTHQRLVEFEGCGIGIEDRLLNAESTETGTAYLHFHPDVDISMNGNQLVWGDVSISFENHVELTLEEYQYAPQFNQRIPARKAVVTFGHTLKTIIRPNS